jgi:hypothetical protein
LESETNSLALVFNKSIWSLLSLFTHHNLHYVLFKQLVHQVMTQCSGSSKRETLEHTSIKRSHGSQTVDDNLNDDSKTWEAFSKATKRSTPEGTEKVKYERKKEHGGGAKEEGNALKK